MPRGSKPGTKPPGRPKGVKNKATQALITRAQATIAGKELPLDFLLRVMHSGRVPLPLRMKAAETAAPYVHARLAQISITQGQGIKIEVEGGLPMTGPIIEGEMKDVTEDPSADDDGFGELK